MQKQIVGWDIGGAHVKAALLNAEGEVLQVIQQPCPLWKDINHLHDAVNASLALLPSGQYLHALTMTGELVDCFSGRDEGVVSIIHAMQSLLSGQTIAVFAGQRGFLSIDQITPLEYPLIASANWLASAQLAASQTAQALFVDIGSTTTDILLIENNTLQAQGFTDYQRLVSGELVYSGVVRTAVMAIARQATFNGQPMSLMAEHFATTADVYRLTGDLNEAHDQAETADGQAKTAVASARRLSRMTGYEFNQLDWALWLAFAQQIKAKQLQALRLACLRQMARSADAEQLYLIGAGVGRFLVKALADELNLAYQDFNQCLKLTHNTSQIDAADCAPAVAVAYLAAGFG